jgi:gas vesicle protein
MQTLARRSVVSVSCKGSPKTNSNNRKFINRTQETIKEFGKKRTSVAKENLNKLVSVSQQEVQELSDLFKELDALHRAQFDEWKNAFQTQKPCKKEGEEDVKSGDEPIVVEAVVEETNIFIDK